MRKLTSFIPERTRRVEPKTKVVSMRLDPHLIDVIDKMAEDYGTSRRGLLQALVTREAVANNLMQV